MLNLVPYIDHVTLYCEGGKFSSKQLPLFFFVMLCIGILVVCWCERLPELAAPKSLLVGKRNPAPPPPCTGTGFAVATVDVFPNV